MTKKNQLFLKQLLNPENEVKENRHNRQKLHNIRYLYTNNKVSRSSFFLKYKTIYKKFTLTLDYNDIIPMSHIL